MLLIHMCIGKFYGDYLQKSLIMKDYQEFWFAYFLSFLSHSSLSCFFCSRMESMVSPQLVAVGLIPRKYIVPVKGQFPYTQMQLYFHHQDSNPENIIKELKLLITWTTPCGSLSPLHLLTVVPCN